MQVEDYPMTKRQATYLIKQLTPRQRRSLAEKLPEIKARNVFMGRRIDNALLQHVEKKLQEA